MVMEREPAEDAQGPIKKGGESPSRKFIQADVP